ncbi:MAG: GH39 family glycosyl hydrolase [Lachnospiraceae bacterium]
MDKKRQIMDFEFSTARTLTTQFHQNLEIVYLVEGEARVTIDEEQFHLKKGDFILINANKKHSLKSDGKLLAAYFDINYTMLVEYLGTYQLLFWCNTTTDKNDEYLNLRKVFDRILNRYFEKSDEGALYLNSLYFEALYLLTSYFMVKADDTRLQIAGMADNNRIFEIQNYVQSNYQKQISLNDLAKQLYLSNAYLSKYIKKRFGLSFLEYLNNVRLFHAVDDLLYTDKKIIRVALDNGFPTTASFNKIFKEAYHMTPSLYRDKIKNSPQDTELREDEIENVGEIVKQYLTGAMKTEEAVPSQNTDILVVDTRNPSVLKKPWGKVINLGDALSLLRSDVAKHLLILKKELGFSYVRIWNIFDSTMYRDSDTEGGRFNYGKLDRALDFLIENQIRPFIDLAFKPTQVIRSTEEMIVESEHEILFKSHKSYEWAMQDLVSHLVNRYGMEEIEAWYFELWQDPRMHIEDPKGWYYDVFETGYRALKKISSNIRVGGAGFILGYENYTYKDILNIWKLRDIWPDFISVYGYRYVTMQQDGILYGKTSLDTNFLTNQLDIFKQVLREANFTIPELFISEWNFTISNRNPINDSCAQGAFIVRNCIEAEGDVDLLAYWHGSDLYSEYYDADAIINGDSGLLTKDGIKKPSFYAFHFLNFLHGKLLGKNEYAIISSNMRGGYTIVCHNCKKLTYRYAMKLEDQIQIEDEDSLYEDLDAVHLKFQIDHVENGNYIVKIYYINRYNGSVQDAWKEMDYTKNLALGEIEYLKRSSMPHVEMRRLKVENHTLHLDTKLIAHEIRALDISLQY